MKKVSIIIPVYNVASFVTACMDSLRAQTMQDIEVIYVDDRGEDNSVRIIADYIDSHHLSSWHIVEMPENGKPARARNYGLSFATGEFVMFIDADDWIELNTVELLYNNARQYEADISSSAAILDFEDGSHRVLYNPSVGSGEITDKQRTFLLRHYVSNFTTMLFRRSWLQENGITFPLSFSGEDSSFMGMCYLVCRRIAQINDPLYHYRIHDDSISHRKHVYRGRQKKIAFRALNDFARTKGLLTKYRWTLYWIYFKKAIVTSVLDYIYPTVAR